MQIRSQTTWTVWCFPQRSISDSRRIYIIALTPCTTNAISQNQSYLRISQIEYCYFSLVTVVSCMPKCKKIVHMARNIIGQKLSYTRVNNHIQFHELVVELPRVLICSARNRMAQVHEAIQRGDTRLWQHENEVGSKPKGVCRGR